MRSLLIISFLYLVCTTSAQITLPLYKGVKPPNITSKHNTRSSVLQEPATAIPDLLAFYVVVGIGTPAQQYTLLFDSGSSDLAVASSSCSRTSCGENNVYYTPSSSSSSNPVSCDSCNCGSCSCSSSQCVFSATYGGGAGFSAAQYTDVMTFGALSATVPFGGISSESNFLSTDVNGIWGMAYAALGSTSQTAFDAFVSQNNMNNMFSVCVGENRQDGDGAVTFGGYGSWINTNELVYTPVVEQIYYRVGITSMQISGQTVSGSASSTAIADTGTSLMLLSSSLFSGLATALETACASTPAVGICVDNSGRSITRSQSLLGGKTFALTAAQIANFQPLVINFNGGASITVSPSNYLIIAYSSRGTTYYTIAFSSTTGSLNILGLPLFYATSVVFDRTNARLGFSSNAGCPASTEQGSLSEVPSTATAATTGGSSASTTGSSSQGSSGGSSGIFHDLFGAGNVLEVNFPLTCLLVIAIVWQSLM